MEDLKKKEEDFDEFQSCCSEEDELNTVQIYFKGVSINGVCENGSGLTGIGVLIEGCRDFNVTVSYVQKRLDFYVEDLVACYLALIDGLIEVLKTDIRRVCASCDSEILYEQIMLEKNLDMPLMVAFRERVLKLVDQFDAFSLKLVPSAELKRPLQLAQVAIGLIAKHEENPGPLQNCSLCCNDKPPSMMLGLRCSHKFCSQCLKNYVNEKLDEGKLPIICPKLGCNYSVSISECKLFLPVTSYDVLEKAMEEFNVLSSEKICCPFRDCLAFFDPQECLPPDIISSDERDEYRVDCPGCRRCICMNCGAPWHSLLSCGEYQDSLLDETGFSDGSLHCLARDPRWRRCQLCRRIVELVQGCHHATCRCGHEFCSSCGAAYRDDGQQTCQCFSRDVNHLDVSTYPENDQWSWNSFDIIPGSRDGYSDQERSQLALIQRFLAGGFSLSDHHHHNHQLSPPPCTDSYIDAMKDIHQLPWLERFVSVISDNYFDHYIH